MLSKEAISLDACYFALPLFFILIFMRVGKMLGGTGAIVRTSHLAKSQDSYVPVSPLTPFQPSSHTCIYTREQCCTGRFFTNALGIPPKQKQKIKNYIQLPFVTGLCWSNYHFSTPSPFEIIFLPQVSWTPQFHPHFCYGTVPFLSSTSRVCLNFTFLLMIFLLSFRLSPFFYHIFFRFHIPLPPNRHCID